MSLDTIRATLASAEGIANAISELCESEGLQSYDGDILRHAENCLRNWRNVETCIRAETYAMERAALIRAKQKGGPA